MATLAVRQLRYVYGKAATHTKKHRARGAAWRRCNCILAGALGAILTVCWAVGSPGQMVYVNNNEALSNTVSALAVNPADGSLTPVPGSPFATGGSGSFAPNVGGISVLAVEQFLYATNDTTNTVAAFAINADGTLTPVPGSPFPTLGTTPNGLAASNDETLLFVTNLSSNDVSVFDIESNGALTLAGSPLAVAPLPLSVFADSPDSLLFVGHLGGAVGVYTVGVGGSSLTAIGGSPFTAGGGERGLDVDAAHTLLYVADGSNNTVSGFGIGGGGALTAIVNANCTAAGVPFACCTGSGTGTCGPFAAGTEPTAVLFHPSLSVLYVSNDMSNDIYVYSVAVDGSLTTVQTASCGASCKGTAGMVIDAANNRLFAINGGSSAAPSRDVSVFDINPATGALTAVSGSPFPTGASSGKGSAIALAMLSRSTCTDAAPGLCSPGGRSLKTKTDCVAEWLVSTTSPPVNPRTNLPLNRVTCQNGNPGCDFDGDGTDDHCTFHVQVCVNNQDPRLTSCSPIDIASIELRRPRLGASSNDGYDDANIIAFETALAGNSCNNEPQTRSCLTDGDCAGGGTCTNPPVIGVPFVYRKTPIIPPPPTPTPAPNSAANICSNIMNIQVPLRTTTSGGFAPKSKAFSVWVRTSNKRVSDGDRLILKCIPAS
jgi:6-phosphogluconolactonase